MILRGLSALAFARLHGCTVHVRGDDGEPETNYPGTEGYANLTPDAADRMAGAGDFDVDDIFVNATRVAKRALVKAALRYARTAAGKRLQPGRDVLNGLLNAADGYYANTTEGAARAAKGKR